MTQKEIADKTLQVANDLKQHCKEVADLSIYLMMRLKHEVKFFDVEYNAELLTRKALWTENGTPIDQVDAEERIYEDYMTCECDLCDNSVIILAIKVKNGEIHFDLWNDEDNTIYIDIPKNQVAIDSTKFATYLYNFI